MLRRLYGIFLYNKQLTFLFIYSNIRMFSIRLKANKLHTYWKEGDFHMNPIDFISVSTKAMKAYESFCQPLCKKYQISQTSFDVLMFLANNPEYNTARDICEIRGIRTGIASVAVDFLVKNGYLIREADPNDRRIWRLNLTEKSDEIVREGRLVQMEFGKQLTAGISEEELATYMAIAQKFRENILNIVR